VSKVASALIGRRFYENLAWMRGGLESAAPRHVDAPPRSVSECLLEAQRWYRGLGTPESQAAALYPNATMAATRRVLLDRRRGMFADHTATDYRNWAGFICMGPVEQGGH
jgi:hypothetical protein